MPRRQYPADFLTGSHGCPAIIPRKQYKEVHARIVYSPFDIHKFLISGSLSELGIGIESQGIRLNPV